MPFVIRKRDSYRWTVEHAMEKKEGKLETVSFDAEFRALSNTKIEELLKKAREESVSDREMLRDILVNWHGLKHEDGSTFEHSEENIEALLDNYPGIAASIARAWSESVLGQAASRKN